DARQGASPDLAPDMTAQAGFQAIAFACLSQAIANAELLMRLRRPEALHQLRVGLRRPRSAMSGVQGMLAASARERIEGELKWLAGELDPARDVDVFARGALSGATDEPSRKALAALGRHLFKAKAKAYDRAVAALQSGRYRTSVLETAAWIAAGPWTQSD